MEILMGVVLLVVVLGVFSMFSLKAPKGSLAMSGLANAAIATFLVEAIHKYILGDFVGIQFLNETGSVAGGMGGVAAAALVALSMGVNPIFALVTAVAIADFGILPGFIVGYLMGWIAPYIEEKLPKGINIILGALLLAPIARLIAVACDPFVTIILDTVGTTLVAATEQSPILMGFFLGGLIKMICTSPLSSMALTAMLGLTGLPMGIAAIACFGGTFTNGIIFKRLKLGDQGKVVSVMLEPLTQADIITSNPLPIYCSNFLGGGLSGIIAASLGIINNAPGTAAPIPGMLAPFAFNDPLSVIIALTLAAIAGTFAGVFGSQIFRYIKYKPVTPATSRA